MKPKKFSFDAKIGKVLKLVVHSIYTNKDIFLRELISNASDAIKKRQYEAITNQDIGNSEPDTIHVAIDGNTLKVVDSGIGMTKEDLTTNLGTIAHSGTEEFMKAIDISNGNLDSLIGQFGVGFYSSFMVASHVCVKTRHASSNDVWIWQSDGEDGYSIVKSNETMNIGTEVILTLKEDCVSRYTDQFAIEYIIKTYSSNVGLPITIAIGDKSSAVDNIGAIWKRDSKSITEEEYAKYYTSIAHSPGAPSLTIHYKAEGRIEFIALLFIPSMLPFDLFHPDRLTRIKLYVKQVFINETNADVLPKYLRFIQGIIDSDSLPLNMNRDTIQDSSMLNTIKDVVTKKVLNKLKTSMSKELDKYQSIWRNFGSVLKEGLCEQHQYCDDILDIALFRSTKTSETEYVSLSQYIDRMAKDQKAIYYCIGDNYEAVMQEPQLEAMLKNDIEILILTDHVDGFWVNVVHQYKEMPIKSISEADIDLKSLIKTENTDIDETANQSIALFKDAIAEYIKDVVASDKLVDSPACLSISSGNMNIKMEKMMMEQNQIKSVSKKTLEINVHHPLIISTGKKLADEKTKELGVEMAKLIFEIACIAQSEKIANPSLFAKSVFKNLATAALEESSSA